MPNQESETDARAALEAVERAAAEVPNLERAMAALVAASAARTRSHVAVWVTRAYFCFIAVVVAYLAYRGIARGENVTADLMDLGKVMVLPVVTLVFGHYYGSRSR